ncbi:hypothetical protein ACLK1T_14965 [Escherichia coli]
MRCALPPEFTGIRSYGVAGRCCGRWHHLSVRVTLLAVDEVFEASLCAERCTDRFSPLTHYRFAQARHLFFPGDVAQFAR